jgi:hypothetical protein
MSYKNPQVLTVASAEITDGSIVNADINTTAAIALTKLATTTASRALTSNSSGVITPSSVTDTELGYLSGVTSAIQTQFTGKAALAGATFTGAVNVGAISSITQNGVSATQRNDQKPSYTLEFESSNWTGAAEAKRRFKFQSIPRTTADDITEFYLYYQTTNLWKMAYDGVTTLYGARHVISSGSTSTIAPFTIQSVVQNSNSTTNNLTAFSNLNAGAMYTGGLVFKNVSHHASTGSADASIWLANGGAATEIFTFKRTGELGLKTAKTPSSAGDAGTTGDFCWDASYLYICTAANTWRRVAHDTWS